MHMFLIFAAAFAVVYSNPIFIDNNNEDQLFYLVPVEQIRQKRQTSVDISKTNTGTSATLGHTGTIFENDQHRVTGNGFLSKSFPGPVTVGGGAGYQHIPSGSNVNVRAAHTPGFGTNVGVDGAANIWRSGNGNSRLDATGGWSRSYGGPFGASRPDYNAGVRFSHRF